MAAAATLFGATGSADAALLMKSDATYAASLAADDIALIGIAIITDPAALDAVSDRIRAMGGAVTFADRQTGFLSAVVRRVDLAQLQQDAQITAIALDHLNRELAGHSGAAPAAHSAGQKPPKLGWQQRVARDRADFLRDLGASQFAHDHPTWDGRGVTIAHVENAPDFLAPELEVGTTLDGKPVAKFRTITSFEDSEPRLDGRTIPVGRDAWQRVTLSEPVRAVNGSIDIAGCRFGVPSDRDARGNHQRAWDGTGKLPRRRPFWGSVVRRPRSGMDR